MNWVSNLLLLSSKIIFFEYSVHIRWVWVLRTRSDGFGKECIERSGFFLDPRIFIRENIISDFGLNFTSRWGSIYVESKCWKNSAARNDYGNTVLGVLWSLRRFQVNRRSWTSRRSTNMFTGKGPIIIIKILY